MIIYDIFMVITHQIGDEFQQKLVFIWNKRIS